MKRKLFSTIAPILFLANLYLPHHAFAADRCADVGNEKFACTHDIMNLRKEIDGQSIDVGVTQRIDGSETEKKAIRGVLKQMDNYFFEEVLAMPEYEHVRPMW